MRGRLAALFWPAAALLAVHCAWLVHLLRGEAVSWFWFPALHWLPWLPLSLLAGSITAAGAAPRSGVLRSASLHLGGFALIAFARPYLSRVLRAPLDLERGPWDMYFTPSVRGAAADALIYAAIAITVWLVVSRESAARQSAGWEQLASELRSLASARLEQQLLPEVIRRGLERIAARAVEASEEAERTTMRLARFVRMVLRTGGEEWIPLLQQARRLKIIASLWHPDARVAFDVPRGQRQAAVPGAVSALVTRLIDGAPLVREMRGSFREQGHARTLEVWCIGVVSVGSADVRMPAGVDVRCDATEEGVHVVLTWRDAARQPARAHAAALPRTAAPGSPLVVLVGMPLLAVASVVLRLRETAPYVVAAYAAVWLVMTAATHPLIERRLLDRRTPLGIVLLAVAAVNALLPQLLFRAADMKPVYSVLDALQFTMLAWVVTGASMAAHFTRLEEWHHRRSASVSDALATAEIVALDANIHPHFFFNVLNTVASQLQDDPAAASRTARTVGRLFDRLTRDAGTQETTLQDELSLLEDYIAIERGRHGERVRLRLVVDEPARAAIVPRLALLTLVQNAVKHGTATMRRPCEIRVHCRRRHRTLTIEATNDVPADAPREIVTGLGLRQLQHRLRLLYGGQATTAFRVEADRFHARLALPIH